MKLVADDEKDERLLDVDELVRQAAMKLVADDEKDVTSSRCRSNQSGEPQ